MNAIRAPWAHFQFGTHHLAWCNTCDKPIDMGDRSIYGWRQPWGTEAVPPTPRKKINAHLAEHVDGK